MVKYVLYQHCTYGRNPAGYFSIYLLYTMDMQCHVVCFTTEAAQHLKALSASILH